MTTLIFENNKTELQKNRECPQGIDITTDLIPTTFLKSASSARIMYLWKLKFGFPLQWVYEEIDISFRITYRKELCYHHMRHASWRHHTWGYYTRPRSIFVAKAWRKFEIYIYIYIYIKLSEKVKRCRVVPWWSLALVSYNLFSSQIHKIAWKTIAGIQKHSHYKKQSQIVISTFFCLA